MFHEEIEEIEGLEAPITKRDALLVAEEFISFSGQNLSFLLKNIFAYLNE